MSGKGGMCRQNSNKKAVDNAHRKGCTRTCDFGLNRRWEFISPVRYLKHVGGKVAAAVARMTGRAAAVAAAPKSNRNNQPPPPKTSVAPIDSQRAEAIHDCINFINSSSSLPRSNSVAR